MNWLNIIKDGARLRCGLLAALLVIAAPTHAMRVSPMVVEMESRGSNNTARIEVQNVNPGNLPFETRVYRIEIGVDGVVSETPADDEFLIFPPQGLLPPGGRQVVRLQWLGDAEPDISQSYYVSVKQLPVTLEPTQTESIGAQVQVLYNMRALVVVAPPGAKPKVKAGTVKQAFFRLPNQPGSEEQPAVVDGVEITLRNEGRRHAMMSDFSWQLVGKDKDGNFLRVDLSPEDLNRAVGTGFVPAKGERIFRVPVSGFGPDPIKLTFKQ